MFSYGSFLHMWAHLYRETTVAAPYVKESAPEYLGKSNAVLFTYFLKIITMAKHQVRNNHKSTPTKVS